jgi:hypothetical protein
MKDNDFGAGYVMLVLAVGSLVIGILAILLQARMARAKARRPAPRGFTTGAAPVVAAFVGGLAGFFVVAFFPWLMVAPAVLFGAFAFGVWRRGGVEARDRAVLLAGLALLWLGLAMFGDRMNRWETTVSGPIRADLLVTAPMAAAWAFLGAWLRREVEEQEEAEEMEDPEGPLTAGIRRR